MKAELAGASAPSDWTRPLSDKQAFEHEQKGLAYTWTFLGLAGDVAKDRDWFRASLATRSVFVQRFGSELKGFENRCAHRFFPLRTEDKGNGEIVCGLHHWRYNHEGRAVGIPKCQEYFGKIPRELDARLNRIELQTCGNLVFGRVPAPGSTETLEHYLGDAFPILAAMSQSSDVPYLVTSEVKANWRLCCHLSLEDYHIVAVHPTTAGKYGYLKHDNIRYFRVGMHSAFFTTSDPAALQQMAAACRENRWRSADYRVFNIFPNLTAVHFRSDAQYFHIALLQFVPQAQDRSMMRAWIYPAPFAANHSWYQKWLRTITNRFRGRAVRYFVKRVLSEDNRVCEQLQSIASQVHSLPLLGKLEERISWFESAYAAATANCPVQIRTDGHPESGILAEAKS